MTIFGASIETIYVVLLIAAGSFTILYLFFGDVLEGAGEVSVFLSPVLILSFITFFSVFGYLLEKTTGFNSYTIMVLSAAGSFALVTLLHLFVLVPLSSAEGSLGYTEQSLEGRVGKLIISVPDNGFGEVFIESKSGMISKPAASYEGSSIDEGQEVLIIEVKNGVLYVVPYKKNFE